MRYRSDLGAAAQSSRRQGRRGGGLLPESRSEFVMVPNWLHGVVAARFIGVYAGLRIFDVPGGHCNPTEAEVAGVLGVSASTVKRAVRDLLAAKAIRVQDQRRGSRNTYSFPARRGQSFSKVPVDLVGRVPITTIGVYCALRSFNGPQGCYPAIGTVAERAGLSHTATQDAVRVLRSVGAIEAAARYRPGGAPTSNLYRFPDLLRQTSQLPEFGTEDAAEEHDWGHQPGAGEVTSRVPVGSPGGHELETLTRESDPEMVGMRPPPAVGQERTKEIGTTAKNLGHTKAAHAGEPVAGPNKIFSPADDAPITSPWFHHPLPDLAMERGVWDLVDLLAEQLVLSGNNKPAAATREAWARTARVMLAHDGRDYTKVYAVIKNACVDYSWSKAIQNMYDISRHWDRLVATFDKRAPKRFKPKTDKLVAEEGPPPVDYSHPSSSLGTVSLMDLAIWDGEPVISPDWGCHRHRQDGDTPQPSP